MSPAGVSPAGPEPAAGPKAAAEPGPAAGREPAAGPEPAADPPGPAVFVLAHHDDEVFCAGHLLQALAEGRPVRLLWATAGGLAPASRRRAEGARVCAVLGLPPAACRDLALPDQGALPRVAAIAAEVERLLGAPAGSSRASAAVVFVPAYEGGHPDHDAVNLAVALVRARRPQLQAREFPLYRRGRAGLSVQAAEPAPGTPAEPFERLRLTDEAVALRRRLVRANGSQMLPSLLPLLALAALAGRGRVEPSRPLPAHDYACPPDACRPLYEFYTRQRFAEFRRVAASVLP